MSDKWRDILKEMQCDNCQPHWVDYALIDLKALREEEDLSEEEIKQTIWDNSHNILRLTQSGVDEITQGIIKARNKKRGMNESI